MDSHAAQESIDKQISAHESAIQDLRTLRNTHAGISKLPIEVLSEIFLLARLPSGTSYQKRRENRGWLNVAGVCRSWREITLNAPRMWDTLNTPKLNTLEWAETLIARSKDVPLHVSCIYPHRATPRAVLDLVFSHIARIQDLDITLSTSLNAKIQDIIDLKPLCVLQSLSLYNQDLLFSDGNGGIDSFLSEAQMPYLRALDLRHFELPHTISVFPQLRHLCHVAPIGPSRTTVSEMLSFLRSTPSLESLEIIAPLRPSENGGMETATVELTKLSFLSYTTPEFSDVSLFRFLQYPPSSRVKFLSYMPPTDTVACTDDLASILTRAASSDAAAATEVSLAAMDGVYFDMQVSGPDGLMLEMNFPVVKGELSTLLKLPVMLPCYGARTLLIRGFHSATVADWANIFTRHSQVQHLTVEDVDSNFFRALLKPTENEPPPFTHLKSLLLSHCDIGEHVALVKRILEEHRQLDADNGVTIKIERCRVARDSIRELEACAKVVWDGIEEYEHGDESDEDNTEEEEEDDDDDDELVFISTA